MNTPLDNAITAGAAAEATLTASQQNVETINTAIKTATEPLTAAETKLTADTVAFNSAMDALSTAALGAKIPVATS